MSVEEARPLMNHAHAYQEQEMQPAGTGPIDVLASGEAGSGAPPILLSIEIDEQVDAALRATHQRLNAESNPNPKTVTWQDFLATAVAIGLERLSRFTAAELLALLEENEEA